MTTKLEVNKPYIPRLNIEITQEQYDKLNMYIPQGNKKLIFGLIVQDLINLCDRHGPKVLALLVERAIGVNVISQLNLEKEDKVNEGKG